MTSALPYVLALLGLLIVAVAWAWMRNAGIAHAELKTVGAAFVATGAIVFLVASQAAGSSKKR